jgi:hypothetical protein
MVSRLLQLLIGLTQDKNPQKIYQILGFLPLCLSVFMVKKLTFEPLRH